MCAAWLPGLHSYSVSERIVSQGCPQGHANDLLLELVFGGEAMGSQMSAVAEDRKRDRVLHRMEESEEPGARVIAKVLRKAEIQEDEAVMWSQNWNAHSRSS
jgi:hypothetical protein